MSEHDEQVSLFEWAERQKNIYPELRWLFAVPNGGKRPQKQNRRGEWYSPVAQKLKAEGQKRGVLDVCLPIARGGYIGFWCEMKYGKNGTTPEQDEWIEALRDAGHYVIVAYNWEIARDALLRYLAMGPTRATLNTMARRKTELEWTKREVPNGNDDKAAA